MRLVLLAVSRRQKSESWVTWFKGHFAGASDPEESLHMTTTIKQAMEAPVREICRRSRRKFAPEDKIRIPQRWAALALAPDLMRKEAAAIPSSAPSWLGRRISKSSTGASRNRARAPEPKALEQNHGS